jgi:hypothetical protein
MDGFFRLPPAPDTVMAGMWRNWLPEAGRVQLDEDGLAYVEARLGTWTAKPRYAGKAATGASLFLGDLLVARVLSAGWRILPNGYPVIAVRPGLDLDVLAAGGVRSGGSAPRRSTARPTELRPPQCTGGPDPGRRAGGARRK